MNDTNGFTGSDLQNRPNRLGGDEMYNKYLILLNNYTYDGITYPKGSIFQIAYDEELPPYYLAKHIEHIKSHEKSHAIWLYDENERGAVCLPFDLVKYCESWETAKKCHFDLLSDATPYSCRSTVAGARKFVEFPETAKIRVEKLSTPSIFVRECSAFFDPVANMLTVVAEFENVSGSPVSTELYFSVFTEEGDLIDTAQCYLPEFARIATNKHIFKSLQFTPYQVRVSPGYSDTPEPVHSPQPLRNEIPTKKIKRHLKHEI